MHRVAKLKAMGAGGAAADEPTDLVAVPMKGTKGRKRGREEREEIEETAVSSPAPEAMDEGEGKGEEEWVGQEAAETPRKKVAVARGRAKKAKVVIASSPE